MASQSSGTQQLLSNKLNLLDKYKRQDKRLKWAVGTAGVIIVLLILVLGFATDWTAGLRKDKTTKNGVPVSSALDSAHTSTSGTDSTGTTTDTGSTSTTTRGTTSTTTNSTTNNTTTNNTTNNPNPTPTPTPTPTPSDPLLNLYANADAGNTLGSVQQLANSLGLGNGDCSTDLLIQTCIFNNGSQNVTVKSVVGTGLVTSIVKNF